MLSVNLYLVNDRRKALLREAENARLVRTGSAETPLMQRAGETLLRLGARFAAPEKDACYTVENSSGQVVTVCPA